MKTTTMTTTDHTLQAQHPLLPFERASDVDPLTNVLRFLDRAVSSRPNTYAMHFELHAPRGTDPFDSRRAFERFVAQFLGDLERDGYAPFCAWSLAGTSHVPVVRVLLLLDESRPNTLAGHLRSAEHAWRSAHGIADANGLVGYYDHPDAHGNKTCNGILIDSNTDSIDGNWADCFRWARMLVDGGEGEITALPAVGFHGTGRDRPATTRTQA
jgi:hypothetical protein